MDKQTGEKYTIAEIGFGMNPNIGKLTGKIAVDEKILGTIHRATSMNYTFGGQNHSSVHMDLLIQHPTVIIDGKTIIENGEYKINI